MRAVSQTPMATVNTLRSCWAPFSTRLVSRQPHRVRLSAGLKMTVQRVGLRRLLPLVRPDLSRSGVTRSGGRSVLELRVRRRRRRRTREGLWWRSAHICRSCGSGSGVAAKRSTRVQAAAKQNRPRHQRATSAPPASPRVAARSRQDRRAPVVSDQSPGWGARAAAARPLVYSIFQVWLGARIARAPATN